MEARINRSIGERFNGLVRNALFRIKPVQLCHAWQNGGQRRVVNTLCDSKDSDFVWRKARILPVIVKDLRDNRSLAIATWTYFKTGEVRARQRSKQTRWRSSQPLERWEIRQSLRARISWVTTDRTIPVYVFRHMECFHSIHGPQDAALEVS